MYSNQLHHPSNFRFAKAIEGNKLVHGEQASTYRAEDLGDNIFRLSIEGSWTPHGSRTQFFPPDEAQASTHTLSIDEEASLHLADSEGRPLLEGHSQGAFGVCGDAWMLHLRYDPAFRFYGCGEKLGRFEKTGYRGKFWNTDVFAAFDNQGAIPRGETDPMYASIPYVIVRTPNAWVGLLVNNPAAPFVSLGGSVQKVADQKSIATANQFYVGALAGNPEIWFLVADSLAGLTRKYQRLIGVTPLPPLWALGHQQCRWGYRGFEDLKYVKDQLAYHEIPNSGLWLDIDYMDEYRVFTWNEDNAADPEGAISALQADGQRIVPIIDPGVKNDPDYEIFQRGSAADAWCVTPAGVPYQGFVWPGETLFPDFASESGSTWWSDEVRAFAAQGIKAAWIDMNEPAVGPAEVEPMLFDHGTLPHLTYHNQYASGMAEATRAGFLAAHPEERPFIISRAGWTGIQRHSALWTGDNLSTDRYLAGSIPCTLNLALSGVPLNGPDVPGFDRDSSEQLAARWYQLAFLFPFLRNHSSASSRGQEPWIFSRPIRENIAHLVRLRYRLLPYLYNLWMQHEETGEAVLRPLLYDFPNEAAELIEKTDDQFLVGPNLMQAPALTSEDKVRRGITLPSQPWFDLAIGQWLDGGERVERELGLFDTVLLARGGSIVPMLPEEPRSHQVAMDAVDLHCFLRPGDRATVRYRADDGTSFAYQKNIRSEVRFEMEASQESVEIRTISASGAWKPISVRFVLYGDHKSVRLDGRELAVGAHEWRATGQILNTLRSDAIAFPSS